MSDLRNIPRGTITGYIADILRGGKDILNVPGKLPKEVPLLGGQGAGDILLGRGPELMNDVSYGFGHGTGSGITSKPDPRIVDLAFTPGLASIPALLRRGGESAVKTVATDMGRREFMKKGAALAGGAALAAASPKLLTKLLREAPAVTASAVEHIAPAVAANVARSWTPELLSSAAAKLALSPSKAKKVKITPEWEETLKKDFPSPDDFEGHMSYANLYENGPRWQTPDSAIENVEKYVGGLSKKELSDIMKKGVNNFPTELAEKNISPNNIYAHWRYGRPDSQGLKAMYDLEYNI